MEKENAKMLIQLFAEEESETTDLEEDEVIEAEYDDTAEEETSDPVEEETTEEITEDDYIKAMTIMEEIDSASAKNENDNM